MAIGMDKGRLVAVPLIPFWRMNMTDEQHQEWKKDLIELHEVKTYNKKLRDALIDIGESLRTKMEIHRPEPLVKPTWFCFLQEERVRLEILIGETLGETSLDAKQALKGD